MQVTDPKTHARLEANNLGYFVERTVEAIRAHEFVDAIQFAVMALLCSEKQDAEYAAPASVGSADTA